MIGALPSEPSNIDSAMATAAALVLAAFLTAIAALHFYWAVGGRRGVKLAIPTSADGVHPLFEPGPIGAAIVGALLLAGATVAMGQLLPAWDVVLLRLMAVVFTLRAVGDFRYVGFLKRVKKTPFAYWDTRLFSAARSKPRAATACSIAAFVAMCGRKVGVNSPMMVTRGIGQCDVETDGRQRARRPIIVKNRPILGSRIHLREMSSRAPCSQRLPGRRSRTRMSRMRLAFTVVAGLVLAACGLGRPDATDAPALVAGDVWIRDVTVVSPELPAPLPGRHVITRNGRIALVTSRAPQTPLPSVTVLEGAGKYLMPGLIDAHVHLAGVPGMSPAQEAAHPDLVSAYGEQLLRSYLYFGFTTVVDLNVVDRARVDRLKRADVGPSIYSCDGALALANGYPMAYLPPATRFTLYSNFLYDPRQAASIPRSFAASDHSPGAAVARVARAGGVCVKAHYEPGFGEQAGQLPVPTVALMSDVKRAAQAAGLPLLLHANSLEAHRFAVDAGADAVVHGLWNWDVPDARPDAMPVTVQQVLDAERNDGLRMMPTARVIGGLGDLFEPAFLDDPQLARVLPGALIAWYRTEEGQWFAREIAHSFRGLPTTRARQVFTTLQAQGTAAAARFAHDGGRLVFGSDTPSAPTYANPPGYNGFLEMIALERAGVSPRALLVAATTEAAQLFGLAHEYGTVQPGKVANLLLLSENPLAAASALDSIETVLVDGRPYQRATFAVRP